MVQLIAFAHPLEDLKRHLLARLLDQQPLETAVEHRVFFQGFAVFLHGGGTDTAQFAPGQGRFEHAAGIGPGTVAVHQGVDLIDKQHHPGAAVVGGTDLLQHQPQAFLKLTAVLGAGDQGPQIEGNQAPALE